VIVVDKKLVCTSCGYNGELFESWETRKHDIMVRAADGSYAFDKAGVPDVLERATGKGLFYCPKCGENVWFKEVEAE
jgi:DNA-directed RNA polymerase subunit M/transcription elongation factor TFIIS